MSLDSTSRLLWIGAIAACGLAAGCSSSSTTTLGRWCDEWFEGFRSIIIIEEHGDGRFQALLTFPDGDTEEKELVESANLVFLVEDSEHGDRYRIVPTTGALEVLNIDGLVSTARPMSPGAEDDDCF